MKKLFISCCILAVFSSSAALANGRSDLQQRLGKIQSFHGSFTQTVTDANGANVQEGEGELWVKRPNLFNWHMTAPDESVIISDGKDLWFYNPFVEQVSVTRLQDATSNTPFILIARNQAEDWKQYTIKQQGDTFELTPKSAVGNLKQFTISVAATGQINQFSAIEQDGQRSRYTLHYRQTSGINADKFRFTPPPGVTVDDQRK
ncbi:outer membrane lipoprotein chaperone LolA [Enterobacteriaceae bacterium LUAb1]